ncbi:MAG: M20/M25/M40 family metallo-hydrolase [Deltaproteobacteria bacterium]
MTLSPVNRDRLAQTFLELVRIDSVSREEGSIACRIREIFEEELGAETKTDSSASLTGSETGNLIVRIPGSIPARPLLFNAHLDTVEPGRGVRPVFQNGRFSSDGSTILGADDKAAIAIMIEAARILRDTGIPHGPMEFLFTVCEEIGLLGAKALDPSLLSARVGFALDSTDPDVLITRAPQAIRFTLKVVGRAAHAGISPELGIHAIQIAAKAMAGLTLGRIDEETTANIGIIQGGTATNIVPAECVLEGEVRSHDPARLREVQDHIIGAFHREAAHLQKEDQGKTSKASLPLIQSDVRDDYPALCVPDDHPIVACALLASERMGSPLKLQKTGGGSDANILYGKGITTAILGTGMQKVHSTGEFILLDDMELTTRRMIAIIEEWAQNLDP